eukprot:4973856-Lingulodinium_polyedra.AAC.1
MVAPSPGGMPSSAAGEVEIGVGDNSYQAPAFDVTPKAGTSWWSKDQLDAERSERQARGEQ